MMVVSYIYNLICVRNLGRVLLFWIMCFGLVAASNDNRFALHVDGALSSNGSTMLYSKHILTGDFATSPSLFALSRCDYSYCLLRSMFGDMPGLFGNNMQDAPHCRGILGDVDTSFTMLGKFTINDVKSPSAKISSTLAEYFNSGLLSILLLLVGYQILHGAMLAPSLDGDVAERNFTFLRGVRIVSGLSLVAPYTAKGYSLLQMSVMYCVLLGVGAADRMATEALKVIKLYPNTVTKSQDPKNPCAASNIAQTVHNQGWLYMGYLYPSLLGAQNQITQGSEQGGSGKAYQILAQAIPNVMQIVERKNCVNSRALESQVTVATQSVTNLIDTQNNTQEYQLSFVGKPGQYALQIEFDSASDMADKDNKKSCGALLVPKEWVNQQAITGQSSTAITGQVALYRYLKGGLIPPLFKLADDLLNAYYHNNNVCSQNEQGIQKSLCNTFGSLTLPCSSQTTPGGGNSSCTTTIDQDERAIFSPYGYNQYLRNGCREAQCQPERILHDNDFVLYNALQKKPSITSLTSLLKARPGQTTCLSGRGIIGNICASYNSVLLANNKSLSDSDVQQMFSIQSPPEKGVTYDYTGTKIKASELNARLLGAVRMVNYTVLDKEKAISEGYAVPTLTSNIQEYLQTLYKNANRQEQAIKSSDTSSISQGHTHLDHVASLLLRPLFLSSKTLLLDLQSQNVAISTKVFNFGASLPTPTSGLRLQTSINMVLERVLGVYFYADKNGVSPSAYREDSGPEQNAVCAQVYERACNGVTEGCFGALFDAGCIRPNQGLLGAMKFATEFTDAKDRTTGVYNPFSDFVQIGMTMMQASSYFLITNSTELTKVITQASGVAAGISALSDLIALGLDIAKKTAIQNARTNAARAAVFGEAVISAYTQAGSTMLAFQKSTYLYFSNIASTMVLILFPIGLLMAIMIPLYPILMFVMGAIAWMVSVMEALFAAPIIALGLAHPDGHDFFGKSVDSVLLLLGVVLRPMVMVMGVFISVVSIKYIFILLNISFVENMYFVMTLLYDGVEVDSSEVFTFLVLGLMAIYMYAGWEIISKISSMSIELGTRILLYLGGQADDLSDIRTRIGTIKQRASALGDSVEQHAGSASSGYVQGVSGGADKIAGLASIKTAMNLLNDQGLTAAELSAHKADEGRSVRNPFTGAKWHFGGSTQAKRRHLMSEKERMGLLAATKRAAIEREAERIRANPKLSDEAKENKLEKLRLKGESIDKRLTGKDDEIGNLEKNLQRKVEREIARLERTIREREEKLGQARDARNWFSDEQIAAYERELNILRSRYEYINNNQQEYMDSTPSEFNYNQMKRENEELRRKNYQDLMRSSLGVDTNAPGYDSVKHAAAYYRPEKEPYLNKLRELGVHVTGAASKTRNMMGSNIESIMAQYRDTPTAALEELVKNKKLTERQRAEAQQIIENLKRLDEQTDIDRRQT